MQDVKLSDQLGAMAIIDELYQQQQLLLEHLDSEKLHISLAEKIKDYYQTRGLTIDEKTINDGINRWFDRRLRFDAPKRSLLQRVLIFCYLRRKLTFVIVAIVFFALLLTLLVALSHSASLKENIHNTYNHILVSEQSLSDLKDEFTALSQKQVTFAKGPVEKLTASISQLLNQEIIPPVPKPLLSGTFVNAKTENIFKTLAQVDASINSKLPVIVEQITKLQVLIQDDHELAQLLSNGKFIQSIKYYPVLQIAVNSVIDSLKGGQSKIDISHVEKLYDSVERATALENIMQADVKQLAALNVPSSDMAPITALQTALRSDLKSLNFENVDNYYTMIAYYVKLAQMALTLTIVDDPDYKSGVQRTHNNTDGKAWFLIVRPMTPAGKSEPLWVKSIETGKLKLVDVFGQQVTQKAFNDVRVDKAQDGHIDNADLCDKPIGRLTFVCPAFVKSGRILEW